MRRLKVRVFTSFILGTTAELLGCSEEELRARGIDLEFNTSGKADLVVVLNTTSSPRWVRVPRGNTIKVLQEPLIRNALTHLYTYHHSRIYDLIYTHSPIGADKRQVLSLPCNGSFVDPTHTKPPFEQKRHLLSIIASNLTIFPGHKLRAQFVHKLLSLLPELEHHTYGRGRKRQLLRKEDGLIRYRYSVAIANSCTDSYITEKFYDCIITGCVPLYYGAPNVENYFPDKSFISLPINDVQKCIQIIQTLSIEDYESRIPALIEARSLIRDQYSLAAIILRHVAKIREAQPSRQRFILLMRIDGFLIWVQKLGVTTAMIRKFRAVAKLSSRLLKSYR